MAAAAVTAGCFVKFGADLTSSEFSEEATAPDALHHVINFFMTHVDNEAGTSAKEIFQAGDELEQAVRHLVAQHKPKRGLNFEVEAKKFDGVTSVSLAGAFLAKFVSKIKYPLMPKNSWLKFRSTGTSEESLSAEDLRKHVMQQPVMVRYTLGHLMQLLRMLQWRHNETEVRSKPSVEAERDLGTEFLQRFAARVGDKFVNGFSEFKNLLKNLMSKADDVFAQGLVPVDLYYHRCDRCLYTLVSERRLDRTFWYEGQYVPAIVKELTQYMMDRPQYCAQVQVQTGSRTARNAADALEERYTQNISVNLPQFFEFQGLVDSDQTVHIVWRALKLHLGRLAKSGQLLTMTQLRSLHPPSQHSSAWGVIRRIVQWLEVMRQTSSRTSHLQDMLTLLVPSLVLTSAESAHRTAAEVEEATRLLERLIDLGQLD